MGTYLVIGMAIRIVADKKEAKQNFIDAEKLKEILCQRFNTKGAYDVSEDNDKVELTINEDVAHEEWTTFLRAFYKLRYGDENYEGTAERLEKMNGLQAWLEDAANPCERYSYSSDLLRWYTVKGEGKYDFVKTQTNYTLSND